MTDLEHAVAYIKHAQSIHRDLAEKGERGDLSLEEMEYGGSPSHHREWVRRYEVVLNELKKSR